MNAEEQIPQIDTETEAINRKISETLEHLYMLEEEIRTLTGRMNAKRTELRKLSRERTVALNFKLFPEVKP